MRGRLKTSTRIYLTHRHTSWRCGTVCSGMRAEASNMAHVVLYNELVFKWYATTHIAFKSFFRTFETAAEQRKKLNIQNVWFN